MSARPGTTRPPESEEKRRRCAEREGRRRARRRRREDHAAATGTQPAHRDGDSSDDELPPAELHHYERERDAIKSGREQLFADALPAWRSVRGVCARLARFRRRDPTLYSDAYVAACLPRLLAPYVRHQLILWNPLADEDNEDYEKMDWYKCLMMYGVRPEKLSSGSSGSEDEMEPLPPVTEETVRDDPDLFLVPTLVNRVVLPKLTELIEHAWDPMCVRGCVRLRALLVKFAALPGSRTALQRLAASARARLASHVAADVFLPPVVGEGTSGAFWRRCLGAGVRLLRATLALTGPPALLHADPVVRTLVDTLSTAAGAAPGPSAAAAAAALAETLPRSGRLRAEALKRLAQLAQVALSRLETDNPLHLKALDQARSVIAEARAME
ncbi:PAX3- and PAX7-binding protein 1-like [Ostrinia furnacalis]|uniref:PAX3- and PAX7-binding protein 1-like n=1 Tax=Ostrinia furnacalis TaxID=93504 RepID=UPI0010394D6D|nr:PAX3- and PAX7-binding protein 1-like [Ostrinia furnacalis]